MGGASVAGSHATILGALIKGLSGLDVHCVTKPLEQRLN